MEYYQKAESQLTDTAAQLEKQMENRVISFSKDSGIIGEDRALTLSKSENAKIMRSAIQQMEVFRERHQKTTRNHFS